jgi:hypothetical protein
MNKRLIHVQLLRSYQNLSFFCFLFMFNSFGVIGIEKVKVGYFIYLAFLTGAAHLNICSN